MDVQNCQSKPRSHPLITVLFLLLVMLLLTTAAHADMYIGRFEGNVAWSFDSATGELRMYTDCGAQAPAWAGLSNQIRTVYIAPGVTHLPRDAFRGAHQVREIIVPDTVTTIGAYAFADCRSLTTLVLPEGLNYVGEHAVTGCSALSYVTFRGSSQDWEALCLQMASVSGNDWLVSHPPAYTQRTVLVTVRYISAETGAPVAPSVERVVTVGAACTVLSPAVDHHTPNENAVVLKNVQANQNVTVVYYRTHCRLRVNYTDELGNPILPSQHFTVAHGASLVLQAPEVEGYTLPKQAEVVLNAVTQDETVHTFCYARRTLSVTVRCLDELGQALCEPIVVDGIPYQGNYSIPLPHFEGYTLSVDCVSGSDLMQNTTQTVSYSPVYHSVTLRYVNEQGDVLAPPDVLTVRHGQSLVHSPRSITGYALASDESIELAAVTQAQSVDIVYHPERYLLTVRHETDTGVLLTVTSEYVTYLERYACSPLPLTGYTAAGQQSQHWSGSMPAAPLTVTIYYQAFPDTSGNEPQPPTLTTDDTPSKDGNSTLPSNILIYVAVAVCGVALLAFAAVLIRVILKKRIE